MLIMRKLLISRWLFWLSLLLLSCSWFLITDVVPCRSRFLVLGINIDLGCLDLIDGDNPPAFEGNDICSYEITVLGCVCFAGIASVVDGQLELAALVWLGACLDLHPTHTLWSVYDDIVASIFPEGDIHFPTPPHAFDHEL